MLTARVRIALLAAVLGGAFAALTVLVTTGTLTPAEVRAWADEEIREPVEDLGPAGPLLFVLAAGCATVVLFPGPLTAAAGGLLFGTAIGFPAVLGGVVLGAALAFGLARWWAHDAVVELAGPRLRGLRAWVGRRGFVSVLYARIAPGVPYNLVNYAAGLTPVRLVAFVGATGLGAAPRAFAYTALGGSFGDLTEPEALVALAVLGVMAVGGILLVRRDLRAGRAARADRSP